LVSSYRLSIVTMSLTAAVWPQFATQVFRGGIGRLTCIGSYINKQVTTSPCLCGSLAQCALSLNGY